MRFCFMALPVAHFCCLFIFFCLSHSAFCCPPHPPFSCGNFTTPIGLPFFTSNTDPHCRGSLRIECRDSTFPMIYFDDDTSFNLTNISLNDSTLRFQDPTLALPFNGHYCSFLYNFTEPRRFNLTRNYPILKSERDYFNCSRMEHTFSFEFLLEFNQTSVCSNYNFYYVNEIETQKPRHQLPPGCVAKRPPLFEWRVLFTADGNVSLLSVGFSDQLVLTQHCFDCKLFPSGCSVNGGQNTLCLQGKKKNTKYIVIGVCVGAALLLAACGLFFVYKRMKEKPPSASNLLDRTSSLEPSSMKDPEYGSSHYQTPIFSYKELQEATNNFDESLELGDGGFGTVYKGKLRDGRTVAVKRLYENNYKRIEQFSNEIAILSRLRHQNLVTLYGCTSRHSRELLLVYEFVPKGTVADHLHGPFAHEGVLTWPVRMNIAIETADALGYLHAVEPQIIHRDVKTNNILLDCNFHVKVADFGLSRLFPVDATHVSTAPQGTPGYVDPEYHQCYQLTDKSDVYSFGVVLVELISSMPAVDITRDRHEINLANLAINKIQNGEVDRLIDPMLGCDADFEIKRMITLVAELAFRCLQADRDLRPAIREVLEVLQGIQNSGRKAENATEMDMPARDRDDARLLKTLPYSPDTVVDKWSSRSTTPNASK